jgi:hypothetical protein
MDSRRQIKDRQGFSLRGGRELAIDDTLVVLEQPDAAGQRLRVLTHWEQRLTK